MPNYATHEHIHKLTYLHLIIYIRWTMQTQVVLFIAIQQCCNGMFRLYEGNACTMMEIVEFEPSSSKLKWLTNRTYCIRKIYRNLIPLFDWMSFSLIIIQMSLYYVPPQSLCIITCWRVWESDFKSIQNFVG